MSVTEIASAIGEWNLTLKPNTPKKVLNKLGYFGHIAITGARVDPELAGDALLSEARYVGVLRDRTFAQENKTIKGAGMAFWLGDEDGKGEVFEEPLIFTNASFQQVMSALLPAAVQEGTIHAVDGLYNGQHVFQDRRQAVDYVASLYDAEWRVNGDGTFDAGTIDQLYVTQPKAAIYRNRSGLELDYKALKGEAELEADVKDFTTRVLLLAEGQEATTVSATADILPEKNPYKTLFGDPVKLTRIISEQQTTEGNAQARAQLQLNRFTSPREALSLSTDEYFVDGVIGAGDYVWVYDPDARLVDETNPVTFHGQELHPLKLRVFQISWPIVKGMGVAFRTDSGEWVDLTEYVEWESGVTNITVGGYNRSLTGVGSGPVQDPGSRPIENSTIPGKVDWNLPFAQSTYQSPDDGLTRAQVVLSWDQPLNTDGSVIQDGYGYEIRYRTGQTAVYIPTHEELEQYRHNQLLGTFGQPIPYTQGAWQYAIVPWDTNEFLLLDLTPGIPYDFQIRAVDTGTPPNVGEWSDNITIQTRPDTLAPSIPATPQEVAGSRNAVQIIHTLGRASGGTFNLEGDLNHLEVHGHFTQDYLPVPVAVADGGTLLGKLPANQGMMRGEIPAVGTFQLDERPDETRWIKLVAVDHFGNRSEPSAPFSQTAELIDSAFISELTVSKVGAGEITATWLMGGTITTAETGARVVIAWYGIEVFDLNNFKTLDIDSTTGDITMTGTLQSGRIGRRVVISGDRNQVEFYPEVGETRYATIYSYIPGNYPDDIALEMRAIDSDTTDYIARHYLLPDQQAAIVSPTGEGGDLMNVSSIRLTVDGAFLSSSTISGSPPYNGTEQTIRAEHFARNDGFAVMASYGSDGDRVGHLTIDPSGESHLEQEGDGDAWNGIDLLSDNVGVFVDGGYTFSVHNNHVRAERYAGTGGSSFKGVIQNAPAGGTFKIRDDGEGANPGERDPVLDADGFSSRYIKNFVIDHPTDADRWLVHACTETPEAAVEYSGVVEVRNWEAEVILPDYFEAEVLEEGRQVWLQVMLPDVGFHRYLPRAAASFPRDGRFRISTDADSGTLISWKVKGIRRDVPQFEVEPLKSQYERRGDGPYTYIVEKP